MTIAAMAVPSVATAAPATSPQKADMAELMKSYNTGGGNQGLIGNSWWQAAIALSTLETYAQATGDTSYDYAIAGAFNDNRNKFLGDFRNGYMDDTGWWGLAWLQAYDSTHSARYLAMAETDANYIHGSWDNTCHGGVWWDITRSYKNAIPNEIFLELTAWLHNTIHGDTKYLRWANAEWSWFRSSGMINSSHLINDGLANCKNNHGNTWTYNQGVILAGLAQLYKATGNASLLTEAESIARAAIAHLTRGGVLHEPCTGCGATSTGGDAESFKGIFVRDLKMLAVTARTTQFNSFLSRQSQSVRAHDTNSHHQLGFLWAGPIIDLTSYCQVSAIDAVVAAVKLP